MQAILLAAGMGKRLKQLTENNTKCMVRVNNVPIINRTLKQLDALNLSKIIIVTGYEGQKLKDHIATLPVQTPIVYIDNPIYDKTNNIYSLSLASDYLCAEDSLLLESDIIFDDSVLRCLVEDSRDSLALVAKYEPWMDGTCVKLSEHDDIEALIPGRQFRFSEADEYFKTVNLYKFSREFSRDQYVPFLNAYIHALGNNEYYEQVLKVILTLDHPGIRAKRLDETQRWYEIDDIQDLDIAESIFADDDEKLSRIQKRYGGYWRYPKLIDFCYLVNPYYPPKKMLDEMRANFEPLLCQYPSGMYVNSLLAAKNFSILPEQVVTGNGAAELIKCALSRLPKPFGIIRPTFEEYPNRLKSEDLKQFLPEQFSYTADDLIHFFSSESIRTLILINPDNPSGNYIKKSDLLRLLDWTKEQNIRFILDESFVDFSSEENPTLIDETILASNPHLLVIKSISKSYGIPGLRLGIAASGNCELIDFLKHDVSIWNINSFAEFYMQIAGKYQKDYLLSLEKLKVERERFRQVLQQIPGLSVYPSEANYLMIHLNDINSTRLARELLCRKNIFIKDLSSKLNGNFIRIAVRTREENDLLVQALTELL